MEASGVHCPACGQIDAVRKVSAIVSEGTSYSEGSGSAGNTYVTVYSKSQTNLSSRLSIPKLNTYWLDQFRGAGIVFLCIGIPFGICGSTLFGGWHTLDLNRDLLSFSFAIIGPVLFVPAFLLKRRKVARDKPKREQAYALWECMYYCQRDDLVFVPGSPEQHFSSSRMRKVLGYE